MPPVAAVLVNPRAGGLIHRDAAAVGVGLRRILEGAGYRLAACSVTHEVETALDALLAGQALDLLVVAAGDGTVRAAAERLMESETALAILPAGTFNLLARDLGVPHEIDAAIEALPASTRERIDAARVNGELFLSACAFGLGAEACELREQVRAADLTEWPETVFDAARRFVGARPIAMRIDNGRRRFTCHSHAVFVANGAFRRSGLQLMRRESLASGHLALYAQPEPNRWQALRTLIHSRFGGFREHEVVDEALTTLTIETRPTTVLATIDGELEELHSPLVFGVARGALTVLRPAAVELSRGSDRAARPSAPATGAGSA